VVQQPNPHHSAANDYYSWMGHHAICSALGGSSCECARSSGRCHRRWWLLACAC